MLLTLLCTYSELDPNSFSPYAPNPLPTRPEPVPYNAFPNELGWEFVGGLGIPACFRTLLYISCNLGCDF